MSDRPPARSAELRAAHILELAANNGLGIDEVEDPGLPAARLAKQARDAVLRVGCASAVKLRPGQTCAICTREVAGRPIRTESIGRGDADVVVCSGWGCDLSQDARRHSFGRGDPTV
jgi:hypothetical protein